MSCAVSALETHTHTHAYNTYDEAGSSRNWKHICQTTMSTEERERERAEEGRAYVEVWPQKEYDQST